LRLSTLPLVLLLRPLPLLLGRSSSGPGPSRPRRGHPGAQKRRAVQANEHRCGLSDESGARRRDCQPERGHALHGYPPPKGHKGGLRCESTRLSPGVTVLQSAARAPRRLRPAPA
jgi:hypothetical protein